MIAASSRRGKKASLKDKTGVWHEPNAVSNAIGYAKFFSRSHDAVIRVYDEAGSVIDTHEHAGNFAKHS